MEKIGVCQPYWIWNYSREVTTL